MLETRNLCKIYKPKKGVPVRAIDNVSLKFPDTGMIFLLGKSGSGKSTMLNLLGGLDKYDSGEIIIKGVSSKDFDQQHFDSYRNTYVGFIFQEYNILDEFSVGANVALAIELQGRKATDEEINRILQEVDLEGYGNRKPNELSGGQKQRVAIARALVKNPEIIMADEPTGALDSNTGKQIFDTLKKLSKDKLVIIVSHDREFSELYADRIIELADGKVISDVECVQAEETVSDEANISFEDDGIKVLKGYHLTQEDLELINAYIDNAKSERVTIAGREKKARRISFKDTDQSRIESSNKNPFKLIKSVIPMKNAFKIGTSALKYKKFKLVITILLSCVAFGLFGLADTFGAYNHVKVCTNSLFDSGVHSLSFAKSVKTQYYDSYYWRDYGTAITEEELEELKKGTGMNLHGAYSPNWSLDFAANIFKGELLDDGAYRIHPNEFGGYIDVDDTVLSDNGAELVAGTLPKKEGEIAVSELVYRSFAKAGYISADGKETKISSYNDLIGKEITIREDTYTVCGIVDTDFDFDRYSKLEEDSEVLSSAEQLVNYALYREYRFEYLYGMSSMIMVAPGTVQKMVTEDVNASIVEYNITLQTTDDEVFWPQYVMKLSQCDTSHIVWFDGEKKTLADNEIILSSNCIFYDYDAGKEYTAEEMKDKEILLSYFDRLTSNYTDDKKVKIVGVYDVSYLGEKFSKDILIENDDYYNSMADERYQGTYSFVIGRMPQSKSQVRDAVAYAFDKSSDIAFPIQNAVTYELETVNEVLKTMSKVFLYIGIGFAVFASIMLANFIATSVAYKKQEIGILRAIGSRSNDVFRIFFSESFVIAMINFVLSTVGVGVATMIINMIFRRYGILISVLTFGIRQVALIFVISIVIAVLASFIPVKSIASKRPIDAIRNR